MMTNNVKLRIKNVAFFFILMFFANVKCYNIVKKGRQKYERKENISVWLWKDERIHHALRNGKWWRNYRSCRCK